MEENRTDRLFELPALFHDPVRRALFSFVKRPVSRMLRLKTLNRLYSVAVNPACSAEDDPRFVSRALDTLGVVRRVDPADLARVPAEGPLIVVANHPYGVVEGLALLELLGSVRPDVKVMANFLLGLVPEMRDQLIGVDPFGAPGAAGRSLAGLKQAIRWVRDGHVLAVFPAGEVASLKLTKFLVADPDWHPGVAGIVRSTKAPVLPVFFRGRNSNLFQAAGLVHPRLRTAMLPRETVKLRKGEVEAAVGRVLPFDKLEGFATNREMIDYLRFRTYLLKRRGGKHEERAGRAAGLKPLARAVNPADLRREVEVLPASALLAESGEFQVLAAEAREIPAVLAEIGRLRELTFRGVGEGTGRASDLDRFDNSYTHLLLWNRQASEVAGAYRFGRTDAILARHGVDGLYTSTLFNYRPGLLERLSPALELGRSFVVPWRQKSYQPLLLMWKGLAAWIARNPRYRTLFGCVSVSGEYDAVSRELIVEFLSRHALLPGLSALVRPRRPPLLKAVRRLGGSFPETAFRDLEDISALVEDVEGGRGIPVLLRQYLKLGGKLLGFNEDPDFGDCMDGLIMVDLLDTDPRVLTRFMGAEEARAFLAFHRDGGLTPRAAA
ncbi:lysophospholipid acyltransferase family protein [Desulfovibrio aminophilus]|nr:lysophospholipid acyltransferase family protein [Desulfovibrio aminophilus]MCM0756865.1 lysophospholipid acyltransferase family protein [Desulfovibrio aminophilus]